MTTKLENTVDALASQCVKCALCLEHCPTYKLTEDENESPRGRIALMQALSHHELPLTQKVKNHLDRCLACRACEPVCPAHVQYGELIVKGRELIEELPAVEPLKSPPLEVSFLKWMVKHPNIQRVVQSLVWAMDVTGIRYAARFLQIPRILGLHKLDSLLPFSPKPIALKPSYKAMGEVRGHVTLFKGCLSAWADQEALLATIFVLRKFGFDISIPSSQTCCGAMALHAGEKEDALKLADQNQNAFSKEGEENNFILSFATGCTAVLREYDVHFSSFSDSFSKRNKDIIDFINECEWPPHLEFKNNSAKVIIHTPCTRRNVLKTPQSPGKILSRIPGMELRYFKSPHCCGAAGTYMLEHEAFAKPLADNLISELDDIHVDFIASSNIGCTLHLQQHLRNLNPNLKVVHPIVLFAKALGFE